MKNHRMLNLALLNLGMAMLMTMGANAQDKKPEKFTLGIYAIKALPGVEGEAIKRAKAPELRRIVESLDSQLTERVNATRKFEVVGRSDLPELFREQDLANSGAMDRVDKNAAQQGKLAGAKYVMTTTIDDFQDMNQSASLEALGKSINKRILRLSAISKIYDSSTGKMLDSANLQISLTNIVQLLNEMQVEGKLSDELIVTLSRTMADKLCNRVTDVIYPAKVVAKFDKQITINRGDGTGIAVDQVWNVFAAGEPIKDPDTGEVLGVQEVFMGKVKIFGVQPKFSTGELMEDRGVTVGSICRLPQGPKP